MGGSTFFKKFDRFKEPLFDDETSTTSGGVISLFLAVVFVGYASAVIINYLLLGPTEQTTIVASLDQSFTIRMTCLCPNGCRIITNEGSCSGSLNPGWNGRVLSAGEEATFNLCFDMGQGGVLVQGTQDSATHCGVCSSSDSASNTEPLVRIQSSNGGEVTMPSNLRISNRPAGVLFPWKYLSGGPSFEFAFQSQNPQCPQQNSAQASCAAQAGLCLEASSTFSEIDEVPRESPFMLVAEIGGGAEIIGLFGVLMYVSWTGFLRPCLMKRGLCNLRERLLERRRRRLERRHAMEVEVVLGKEGGGTEVALMEEGASRAPPLSLKDMYRVNQHYANLQGFEMTAKNPMNGVAAPGRFLSQGAAANGTNGSTASADEVALQLRRRPSLHMGGIITNASASSPRSVPSPKSLPALPQPPEGLDGRSPHNLLLPQNSPRI